MSLPRRLLRPCMPCVAFHRGTLLRRLRSVPSVCAHPLTAVSACHVLHSAGDRPWRSSKRGRRGSARRCAAGTRIFGTPAAAGQSGACAADVGVACAVAPGGGSARRVAARRYATSSRRTAPRRSQPLAAAGDQLTRHNVAYSGHIKAQATRAVLAAPASANAATASMALLV